MMELWPFTNFHDLNLDWIIKTIKVYTKKVDDFIADITEAWDNFKDWTTGEIDRMHDDFAEYVNVTEGALNTGAIADGAITESKINSTFLREIANNYVTPQMFGAVGDGVADDTTSLQTCFDTAFTQKKIVFIPSGVYNHTGLTISCSAHSGEHFTPSIIGNDKTTTILQHTGSGVGVSLIAHNTAGYIDGINIYGIHFEGNTNTTIGLELHQGTRIRLDNITVTNASDSGIKQAENFWMSSLTNIYIGDCVNGLYISGASVTSIYYNEIYVVGASGEAYHLTGGYSTVGVMAADQCTGTYGFNFYYFRGSAQTLSCEACNVTALFRFDNAHMSVGMLSSWSPVLNDALTTPVSCSSSNLSIESIGIGTSTATTSALPLMKLYYTNAEVAALVGNITFADPVNSLGGDHSYMTKNGVKVRTKSNRAYIGNDRSMPTDMFNAPFTRDEMGVALFTDCTGGPNYRADGTDVRWDTPVKNGDWFIENDPNQYGVAAYVIMQDYSGEADNAKRGVIPVLLANTTSERPTTFPKGGVYFDTTLNKPIWYNGSNWVDSTGTTV